MYAFVDEDLQRLCIEGIESGSHGLRPGLVLNIQGRISKCGVVHTVP